MAQVLHGFRYPIQHLTAHRGFVVIPRRGPHEMLNLLLVGHSTNHGNWLAIMKQNPLVMAILRNLETCWNDQGVHG